MKKKSKLIFGALSLAAFAGGAYYFVKNILNKDSDDDFDDFEDDFDDFDVNDDNTDGREYVTINIAEDNSTTASEEAVEVQDTEEPAEETEPADSVEEVETTEEVPANEAEETITEE